MKKIALAIAAASLSTAAFAGPLDYNHVSGNYSVGFGETNDDSDTLGAAANMRLDGGLFVGGAASYVDAAATESVDASAEVGIALDLLNGEMAIALGAEYSNPTGATSETNPTARAQYTYSCDNGRFYELEYSHTFVDQAGAKDDNSLSLGVEGGDRNSWRYEAAYTRGIEAKTQALGFDVIFPLAPQDQGEIVMGASNTWADSSNQDGYELNVGYRWNLD